MYERHKVGLLAEAKVLAYLIEKDIEPYLPFADNGPVDILGIQNTRVLKISVKSTNKKSKYNSWTVELRTVSRRKESICIKEFDNSKCDILAVYIQPLDRVILLDAQKIKSKSGLSIMELERDERIWLDA